MVYGTLDGLPWSRPSASPAAHFGGPLALVPFTDTKGYIALTAFVINVVVAVLLTFLFRGPQDRRGRRPDARRADYHADAGRPRRRRTCWKASRAPLLPPGNLRRYERRLHDPLDGADGTGAAHGGEHAVAVAAAHGVETMFTLSGAHVFPMYDGAVKAEPPMRILDVRHEQTAAFAAEATGKLTRVPGLAVLTAGPGVTNGVSAIAQAQFSGLAAGRRRRPRAAEPLGQRQPPGARPAADRRARSPSCARTVPTAAEVAGGVDEAFTAGRLVRTAGRCSSTSRWTSSSTRPPATVPAAGAATAASSPTPTRSPRSPALLAERRAAGAGPRHRRVGRRRRGGRAAASSRTTGIPAITNGMGRGVVPGGHPLLVTKARGKALRHAPTWSSWSARRWTSGSATASSAARTGRRAGARRAPRRLARPGRRGTPTLAASASGDLTSVLDGAAGGARAQPHRPDWSAWVDGPPGRPCAAAAARDAELLARRGRPDPPGPHLRRAGPPARRRRGRDRRRRRLRRLRRQVRRAEAARRLARPRPLRLPRRRPRLGDRRPARPARRRRSCCCSATARPASR